MYKVFINDKVIYLIKKIKDIDISKDDTVHRYISLAKLLNDLKSFEEDKKASKLYIHSKMEPHKLFVKFASLYTNITAAGGIVRSSKGEILFIFRHKKWDLPKGKVDFSDHYYCFDHRVSGNVNFSFFQSSLPIE